MPTEEIRSDRLAVEVEYDPLVYYALQQNGVPLVKAMRVRNLTDTPASDLHLRVWAEPDLAPVREVEVPPLGPNQTWRLDALDLLLPSARLTAQTERESGRLWVELRDAEGAALLRTPRPLEILAYGEWPGTRSLPEILAAFVLPNHPAVAHLLAAAGRHLGERTQDPSLDGYQRKDPARVHAMVRAIYEALVGLDLGYVVPPASFEKEGQKIRTPEQVVDTKMGTCLDVSTLFAALLEQAGLHPLVVLFEEHALVGVWLGEECFVDATVDEPARLRKRIAPEGEPDGEPGSLLFVEAAGLTARPLRNFDEAVADGARRVLEDDTFLCAVDVRAARKAQIRPLPSRAAEGAEAGEEDEEEAPVETAGPIPRVERWKRKLLDLSLRNRLLNYRSTKRTIRLRCPDVGRLEDLLASGKAFRLRPDPADGAGLDPETLTSEMERGALRTEIPDEDLARRLTQIYRSARTSLQEGGANTLYLAIGFLSWFETPSSTQERLAPILLYPLTLTRKSVAEGSKGFRFELADDDPQINVTLLQKLESDFELDVAHLRDLDADENGLDVAKILGRVREAVRATARWSVLEDTALGLFSFTKYLMWLDLDRRSDVLTENAVVHHLLETPEEVFPVEGELPDPATLDATRPPTDTFVPLDADSSQLGAIFAAADGHTFVLEGPPGTGKSQTISNLVCHALATGKRVLFVSEKMAALNVVHKRLSKVGLAPFCLELHSNKARKRGVLEQLRAALEVAGTDAPDAWPRVAERLGEARAEVNAHAECLHRPRAFGKSAFHGISRLVGLADAPRVKLALGASDAVDAARREQFETLVEEAGVALADVGDVREHAWRAANTDEWAPSLDRAVDESAPRVEAAADVLERASTAFADDLKADPTGLSRAEVEGLETAGRLLAETPAPPEALLVEPAFDRIAKRIEGWIALGKAEAALATDLGARYTDALLELDLHAIRRDLDRSRRTVWPFSWWRARGAKKALKAVMKGAKLGGSDALLADIEEALAWQDRRGELQAADADARANLGAHWAGRQTDWAALAGLLDWTRKIRPLLARFAAREKEGGDALRTRWLARAADGRTVLASDTESGRRLAALADANAGLTRERAAADQAFQLDPTAAWGDDDEPSFAARARSTAAAWRARKADLRSWCGWVRAREAVRAADLAPLLDGIEAGDVAASNLVDAFEHSFYAWWVDALFEEDERLRRFRGAEQTARVATFRRLDAEVMQTTREVVRARLADQLPTSRAAAGSRSDSSEMGILHRELLKRRNMPIRRLFERIPNVLVRLKPCLLMSPLSVAQYLGPDFPAFDLVVFDEASQIPPWDAVGAVARGEKLVVVGDSKQLPPTTFFQRAADPDQGLDEDDLQEMESILDECIAAGLPRLHLGWHYRSRHESLIAFSNHHYYEDRLTTFPSAVETSPRLGVTWRHVADGCYDKGRSRTNRREAEVVVEELFRRLQDPNEAKRTYGIVTFSIAQASLVEDLLEAALREHPELEHHFDESREEPVFVKNLENVQGDERDVIFLSVCYGPDEQGRVILNFGPLNRNGGERRLNVAVTRSREQVIVFSTLRAEQIDLARTQARGAAHLKAFLEYAEQGTAALGTAANVSPAAGVEAATGFEAAVRAALEAEGYPVAPSVGCSAYRVDLGVRWPEDLDRYLLAVEGDGTTYGRALTARDRHRTRPGVLKHLGWHHHRAWSIDWWHDPARELARLREALEAARKAAADAAAEAAEAADEVANETPDETEGETEAEPEAGSGLGEAADSEPAPPAGRIAKAAPPAAPPETETPLGIRLGGVPYRKARLRKLTGDPRAFYESRAVEPIVRRIEEVIDTEAPVAQGLVARRLADAWGLKRLTTRLRDRVGSLLPRAQNWRFSATSSDFLWRRDQDPGTYAAFRVPGEGGKPERRARHVPPEEIAIAAHALLKEHIAIGVEDLARETSRLFGFRRFTDKVRGPMENGVRLLVERGQANLDEDTVKLP